MLAASDIERPRQYLQHTGLFSGRQFERFLVALGQSLRVYPNAFIIHRGDAGHQVAFQLVDLPKFCGFQLRAQLQPGTVQVAHIVLGISAQGLVLGQRDVHSPVGALVLLVYCDAESSLEN